MVIRLGVTRLRKTKVVYLQDSFEGRGEKWQYDLVCGAPLDDWFMRVDVLITCSECGFNYLGSWLYYKEWVWNLGTKSICIASKK